MKYSEIPPLSTPVIRYLVTENNFKITHQRLIAIAIFKLKKTFIVTTQSDAGAKIILVVEDHTETREVLSMLLRQNGMAVIEAADGIDALNAILKTPPHLILTDLRMPNMDGLELSRYVKSTAAYRHIPIVLISATPPPLANRSQHPEIAMFIQKPYPVADIVSAISGLL